MHTLPYHIPALLPETLAALCIKPEGTYVDCTFGGGGHSRAILQQLGPNGRLFAFDQDPAAEANAAEFAADSRFRLIPENFLYARKWLRVYGGLPADGLLADLGVSFHQFDEPGRGFTFREDAPLDMRMDTRNAKTAAQLLADAPEEELMRIFRHYGELPNARHLSRSIVSARATQPIATTGQLVAAIEGSIRKEQRKKYLAQVFQAIRIAVNDEMAALEALLAAAPAILGEGGRMVVISYHSLEDRLVKRYLQAGNAAGAQQIDFFGNKLAPFTRVEAKAIVPGPAEIEHNPRARSAKLRIGQRTAFSL